MFDCLLLLAFDIVPYEIDDRTGVEHVLFEVEDIFADESVEFLEGEVSDMDDSPRGNEF